MKEKPKSSAGSGDTSSKSHSLSNVLKSKGTSFYRDAKKVRKLSVLKSGRAIRNAKGDIIKEAIYQTKLPSGTQARVQGNRKYFENTRTISQTQLDAFTQAINSTSKNPFQITLTSKQAPIGLTSIKTQSMHLLSVDSYAHTFGVHSLRKKPKIMSIDYAQLSQECNLKADQYDPLKDSTLFTQQLTDIEKNPIFAKGQSKRIWNELYKVIDSSDVIIHVLDARDPEGTRCRNVENFLKKEATHKHLVFCLNKVDLVPTWVTAKWKKLLEKEYPTVAFHANINNPFGKSALMSLLRQFSKLHSDKKQISIGFVGYPNTGKSSIINTLKQKKVCNVAPIPGETRCWQYIALMKRIYLIDCPGVVYGAANDSETDIILKGVIRVENVENTEEHIPVILARCRRTYIENTYGVSGWSDHLDFLRMVAEKGGKLLKGGEADLNTVSKMILNDWIRGKIPFYTLPIDPAASASIDGFAVVESGATEVVDDKEDNNPLNKEDEDVKKIKSGPKTVQQRMKNIRVVADFSRDDMRNPDDDQEIDDGNDLDLGLDDVEPDSISDDGDHGDEGEDSAEDGSDFDADAQWDKVFEEAIGGTSIVDTSKAVNKEAAKPFMAIKAIGKDSRKDVVTSVSANVQDKASEKPKKSISKPNLVTPRIEKKQKGKNGKKSGGAGRRDDRFEDGAEVPLAVPIPRMTTSKTKATNYYTNANVKNKNRK